MFLRHLTGILMVATLALMNSPVCGNAMEREEKGTKKGQSEVAVQSAPGTTSLGLAPDFRLNDINGGQVTLAQFKGKVVILDFWATWCLPCIKELPHFKTLLDRYGNKGLEIVGIALDKKEETVQTFVDKEKLTSTVVMGDEKVVKDYGGITGIPTTFILDREGRIIEKFIGYRNLSDFETVVKKLL